MKIDSFTKEYSFLSNFYMTSFFYNGKEYKSVEHAYQSHKSTNEIDHEYIRNLETPIQTKRAARNINLREDWENIKYDLMLNLIRTKFKNMNLAKKLSDTEDNILIEGNYWHDNVWGVCSCEKCENIVKKNWLGEILMIVRNEIST